MRTRNYEYFTQSFWLVASFLIFFGNPIDDIIIHCFLWMLFTLSNVVAIDTIFKVYYVYRDEKESKHIQKLNEDGKSEWLIRG